MPSTQLDHATPSAPALKSDEAMVVITRVYDAPRELVFQAWTSPQHLARWYAPQGCTIEFRSLDFRVGGTFHSCIHIPDGKRCWCAGVYREIFAPERIVFSMSIADEAGRALTAVEAGMDPEWPQEAIVTVTLADQGSAQE